MAREDEEHFLEREHNFESSIRQALADTRMETDRKLLALSAGGIGLLVVC